MCDLYLTFMMFQLMSELFYTFDDRFYNAETQKYIAADKSDQRVSVKK